MQKQRIVKTTDKRNKSELMQLDDLDRKILNKLIEDARIPYAELAKQFKVSPATIHVRIEKMKAAGIVTGTHLKVAPKKLGYDVCCYIGINLKSAGDYYEVIDKLKEIEEVVEAHYTTGKFSIFIKVRCHSIDDLQWVLIGKIQSIEKVSATETLISLQNPIDRTIQV